MLKYWILLQKLAILLQLSHGTVGLATTFKPDNDPQNPAPFGACVRRDLTYVDIGVAHRTLPCKSKVWIYNPRTKKSVVAIVMDRGPRHAAIDLLPATSKLLGSNGYEKMFFLPLR